jgi:phosphatidylserine/phosphatidylglycerophosphate/cardiolipin synthase-like enzyme
MVVNTKGQDIRVYFNQSVDNSVSGITDAKSSSHLEDTICALINLTNKSIDVAVWDNGSTNIVTALNNAYARGVRVRYISSTNSLNSALSGLNSSIPVLKRTSGLTSNVMHNKFVIFDSLTLLTGSMNFGLGSMVNDYNNIVIIKNTDLAQNYTAEFNEMWGSSGALPDLDQSKFGPAKTDNTIHSFNINGIPIQNYFSPTDHTTEQIVTAINSADHTLDIAIFTFINNDIGDAVIAAKNRGVTVRCIIENISYIGSEYNNLINNGIIVLSHENIPYDFHHKYCVVDALNSDSDPLVVTGSHNWTNSAEDDYDENILIIHNEIIANQYLEEFSKRFYEFTGMENSNVNNEILLYPNPTTGLIYLHLPIKSHLIFSILNLQGDLVRSGEIDSPKLDLSSLSAGMYFLRIVSEDHQKYLTQKIIKR